MSGKNRFIIGGFEFETYYEYRAAQEDVKKIECINEELDIQDPEVALRLYNDIRDGIIVFNSPIGKQYAEHVADIVANKSAGMLDDREIIEEAAGKAKSSRRLGLIFVSLAVVLVVVFAGVEIKDVVQTRKIAKQMESAQKTSDTNNSQNNVNINNKIDDIGSVEDSNGGESVTNSASANVIEEDLINSPWDTNYAEDDRAILPELTDLYAQNQDLVGVLTVVDTDINYPVVQTPNDPEYYLRRDFNGNDSTAGTLFVDYRCDIVNPTTNTIIYGHNMRSGAMFGGLKRYLKYDYYQSHKTIIFKTLYEEQEYEVVGVGLSQVGYDDDDAYKYYNFIDAVTGAELQEFLNNIQSLSAFDETIDISSTDKILTLSTCNTYKEDGRMFIVAKRVK
ncbi:class B sortase [Pseudobutyrivibrio xylanivorans]|uniref:Class B sortase n=1 Tax=Pseudobutyrivibrio xylanivorans TaxID=185007 RepID=A0A5P6VRL3_PSEXY|nr:class B sortase [Pseudobutyrivibrio xylanivorans]QFJ55052.1 class B sortase [Pseudobutyrivibrio xylanivorans]